MDAIKKGWFSETNDLWPGQCLSLKVEEILYQEKSDFQDVLVVKTSHHGNALILDGVIQCTKHDEFAYQEMISFLPLCAHKNPVDVLIVGGGDGGVAREVTKFPSVQRIIQVEIDGKVIEVSKKYLPFMSSGFTSPKLDLKVRDGFEFMKNHKDAFDVIITDSSDPVGPAENLFTEAYFELLKGALKPNGIICSQGGDAWTSLEHIRQTLRHCAKQFPKVAYAQASVPTYPSGQIGFVIASRDAECDVTNPTYKFTDKQLTDLNLRYYDAENHAAAFVLPRFVKQALKEPEESRQEA